MTWVRAAAVLLAAFSLTACGGFATRVVASSSTPDPSSTTSSSAPSSSTASPTTLVFAGSVRDAQVIAAAYIKTARG